MEKQLIQVTKEQWKKISNDYKGKWTSQSKAMNPNVPDEFIGRKRVMAGCIENGGGTTLLTEGIHFEIID